MTDTITNLCTDVLVVGGGMAACTAAIAARKPPVEVLIIDKGRIGFSGTSPRCGGGGTGWVLLPPEFGGDPRDSHDVMLADCVKGGEYLNVQEHTEILNVESLERLLETEVLGVHYHRTPEGKYPIARTMAFSYPRPPSSNAIGGSQVVMKTIREAVLSRRISTLEHVMVTRLFLENNRIAGDFGINVRTGDLYSISAGAVILASGSATGLYKYPTCVNELTGDSYALAFEAGASLMNMEFLQFSITGMIDGVHVRDIGGIKPMIANGVRWVNARGEAFMSRYDPARAEFTDWWRNIYAISKENQEGRGPVYLDMSKVAERVKDLWEDNTTQGPYAAMQLHGLSPRRDRLALIPGLHTFLGGMIINSNGESSIPGLYGAGEAAGQAGVFGADRVGSGIGAAQVFGHRAGKYAAAFALQCNRPALRAAAVKEEKKRLHSLLRKHGEDPFAVERIIKEIALQSLGICRTGPALEKGANELLNLRTESQNSIRALDTPELVKALEVQNLALTGEMSARAARMREESRGQHRREDYPGTDNENWLKWITIAKSQDEMRLGAVPVPIGKYKLKPEGWREKT
ncbi:MAG: FAD-dependent oxidoreductase [Chloroflexi bacterium]|nr:FAD-dependent oxidoreductase [Chloroflexota bacterium]